ncbi:MAG: HAMP domain-containing sensor histidine kinase [Ignavibacteria bacterium]|nr:HAMP domain-containing sensor histidine kinase [Ignavibacteria bacterium]
MRKFQSDFITSTSHQFRTPLATFQSSIELLEYYINESNTDRQLETIQKIKRTLRYLNTTIENITTLYRHTSSKQKLSLKSVNLQKFSNDLLDELVFGISKTHFLQINIEHELKEITSDEFVLKQILLNLIHNAIKFSPNGGQIKLEILPAGKYIEFVVKDEGIGINKDDLKKIFTPFIRGKNATSIPGAGLGLAIVRNLARLLKAKMDCSSKLNEGSTFRVRIPWKV